MSKGVPREPRETRLLSEWIAANYSGERVIFQARLGITEPGGESGRLSPAERRMVGVFRRYADALILRRNEIVLIEACIKPAPGKIGELAIYSEAIPVTEELDEFRGLPVSPVLLCAFEDMFIRSVCGKFGIHFEVFAPAWVEDYLALREGRKGIATQPSFQVVS